MYFCWESVTDKKFVYLKENRGKEIVNAPIAVFLERV